MKEKTFSIIERNKKTIHGVIWLPDTEIKAILQITHGMTEHIYRYKEFAKTLCVHGIAVAGFDLPGHGRNLSSSNIASFGKNGWQSALENIHDFSNYLQHNYPNIQKYILGFSLGSFLVREYLNKYEHIFSGAVIAGTGHQPALVLSIMMSIVKRQIDANGFDNSTPLVKKLSFDTYNNKFKPTSTDFDWLCSDEKQLHDYINDKYCANAISSGLFWQLLSSMKYTGAKSAYSKWDKQLPILLISGGKDPVGDFCKGILRVEKSMRAAGIFNVSAHILPNARHDIFHEVSSGCSKQLTKIIIDWIE